MNELPSLQKQVHQNQTLRMNIRIHDIRHVVLGTLKLKSQKIFNKKIVMVLTIPILEATNLLQISSNCAIQLTYITDIFLPQGNTIYNQGYASFRISINTTNLFAETQNVCQSSRIIRSFIKQREEKSRLSKPNNNLMKILLN